MSSLPRTIGALEVAIGDVYIASYSGMTFIVTDISDQTLFVRIVTYYVVSGMLNVAVSGPHRASLLATEEFLTSAIIVFRRRDASS